MKLLIRMLEKQKWEKVNLIELGHTKTPADTITSELRTSSNTLSLWFINSMEELVKGVLALSVARNKITRLDVMILEEQELIENDLVVKNTPENGHSPYEEFNDNHYDLIELDYEKLGNFSRLIIANLNIQGKCIRFDKAQVSDILYQGYKDNLFELTDLNESLQTELTKVIAKKDNQ